MLITSGGLKAKNNFLRVVDAELLLLFYEQKLAADQVELNFRNPQPKDILGEGLVSRHLLVHANTCFRVNGPSFSRSFV